MYRYRAQRPSGLKYELKVENRGWFQAGRKCPTGSEHPSWRGDAVGYKRLHGWVKEHRSKPERCEWCSSLARLDWANLSHEYRRDLSDWVALCRPCHARHDSGDAHGKATLKYGADAVAGRK